MTECVRCERPMPDQAYACAGCADRARGQLRTIADMTPAARDVALGQARNGTPAAGETGPRIPLNLAATARLDAVQNTLGTWMRHVADERGVARARALVSALPDPIVLCAEWLPQHLEWIRHRKEADELLCDVAAAARIVAGIARGPAEQKFLGPCGAPTEPWTDDRGTERTDCPGDVYAHRGSHNGACRSCGTRVTTAEREAWLDGEVRGHAFRASQIAEAYGVNVNTIRSWHGRGQLANHGTDADGRPLFNVGEVLDLAAADAARRATEQAKRARRAAVKAAESERMSA